MSSESKKNIIERSASGIILFAIVVSALLISSYTFLAITALITICVMWEMFSLMEHKGYKPTKIYTVAIGIMALMAMFLESKVLLALLLPAIALQFIIELFRNTESPTQNICISLGSLVYAALPMGLLSLIASWSGEYNPKVVLSIIFTVWVNDVFAFFVGSAIGKHKLFPRISPKKSWEGLIGGALCATLFSMLAGRYFGGNELVWAGMGLLIAITSVFGDLVESMFKRDAGVKDSGNLIPGHGGMMDRFDALLIAIPFVYTYFTLFNP